MVNFLNSLMGTIDADSFYLTFFPTLPLLKYFFASSLCQCQCKIQNTGVFAWKPPKRYFN